MLFSFTLAILLPVVAIASPVLLPNVEILGLGYELAKASARPTVLPFDPGFRAPIFDSMRHDTEKTLTADHRFLVPSFVNAVECSACQGISNVDAMTTFDEYKEAQTSQTSSGLGIKIPLTEMAIFDEILPLMSPKLEIGFSSNQEHRVAEHEFESKKEMRVESLSMCSAYCASMASYNLSYSDFSANFIEAVRQIRPNRASYSRFIDTFGTHFVSGVVMGSALYRVVKFDQSEWAKMNEKYDKIEKSMSISLGVDTRSGVHIGWGFGLSKSSYTYEEELKASSEAALSLQDYTIGAVPTGDVNDWQNDSFKQAMPIRIQVSPIAALLTRQMFPFDNSINKKRQWITNYNLDEDYEEFLEGIESGQNLVESMDTYGGSYADNFIVSSSIINPYTKKKLCPDGYDRITLLMKRTGALSSFTLCNDGYAELNGPFGGFYAKFWRNYCPLKCKPGSESYTEQGLEICDPADKIPDVDACRPYLSYETETSSYVISHNNFTGNSSCPPDFQEFHLVHVTECTVTKENPCANTALRIEIMACFNKNQFVKGYSNIGGFYSLEGKDNTVVSKNPVTDEVNCKFTVTFSILV